MESVVGIGLDFKALEKSVLEKHLANAREEIRKRLEEADQALARERDKRRLRHKGKRKTTIRTLMGAVEIRRNLYRDLEETRSGVQKHVFLLDGFLGLPSIGKMSVNLVEQAVDHCTAMPFRKAADILSTYTDQGISHQTVWTMFQKAGERMARAEKQKVKEFRLEETTGKRQVPVLFEEADGVHVAIQKRGRTSKAGRSRELKVGVVYEGWEKRYAGATQYRRVNKKVFAGFMRAREFHQHRQALVGSHYDLDEVKMRVLNGDGASWIQDELDSEYEMFQLDPYHLQKAICRNVRDKRKRSLVRKRVREGNLEEALQELESLKYESGGLADEVERLTKLQTYLCQNRQGLRPWRDRSGMDQIQPPSGMEYRTLGTMERTVELFDRRMDGPLSWSLSGATHMAKILSHKVNGTLREALTGLWHEGAGEKLAQTVEEPLNDERTKQRLGNTTGSWRVRQGRIPYEGAPTNMGRKVIRHLFEYQKAGGGGYL